MNIGARMGDLALIIITRYGSKSRFFQITKPNVKIIRSKCGFQVNYYFRNFQQTSRLVVNFSNNQCCGDTAAR